MFCCTIFYVHSSIAIILMGKRELVALLNLSSWCLVMVERLFLAVPWGCLRFVIVVFPDHTHLLFFGAVFASKGYPFKNIFETKNRRTNSCLCNIRKSCWMRVWWPLWWNSSRAIDGDWQKWEYYTEMDQKELGFIWVFKKSWWRRNISLQIQNMSPEQKVEL